MDLSNLTEAELKLIRKLRQFNINDIRNGIKVFESKNLYIQQYIEEMDIYVVNIENDRTMEVLFSVTVGFSNDGYDDSCSCGPFLKTKSCKHITAATIAIAYNDTDLEIDELKNLP